MLHIIIDIMYYFYIVHACNVTQESLFHELNPKLNIFKYIYYLIQGLIMIITMDKQDKYLRENIGFEINKGSFELTEKKYKIVPRLKFLLN